MRVISYHLNLIIRITVRFPFGNNYSTNINIIYYLRKISFYYYLFSIVKYIIIYYLLVNTVISFLLVVGELLHFGKIVV